MTNMWMVRAGESGFLIDRFENENIVVIGWEIGDLTNINDKEELKNLIKDKFPDKTEKQIISILSVIGRFRFDFNMGDKVVSYNPQERTYLVGEITSDYIFDPNFYPENPLEYCDVRKVKWLGKVKRDDLLTSTKNTLGSVIALFKIYDEPANDLLRALDGKKVEDDVELGSEDESIEILKDDMLSKSHEFVKDKIVKLDWDEMQDLVAGLLRAMGYKTRVSPKGADMGKDILASPDGLGLEDPRIVVEVKHQKGKMGADKIRSFTGGLRSGSRGLYVSTGGFSQEAKYEAERSEIPITLMDLDMLVRFIVQYYDQFDNDARSLIPLTKIYWPI
ncbi:restriction endonuclease [Methanobacterium alcaliphilum]|uniref:restriction endonuclease n=1 Tax=Methanobacterium alcaliphilum TaxID=392018 RepID=UPI00200A4A32|nr:restriction endonuclease [Methanobacterium alcaliphilum]MCK9150491.1 restriction endonuclease [Methanobacterium alcaliphilum]